MKGNISGLTIGGRKCSLYLPPDYEISGCSYPVVYMNGAEDITAFIEKTESHFGTDCEAFILLGVEPFDWNDDFSPWSAPALSAKSSAFGGCAAEYLAFLSGVAKPRIDIEYRTRREPEHTAIIGYSLGGLAALYAAYTCPAFGKFASLSGSLWFDGWVGFVEAGKLLRADSRIYISLGKGEEHSRNPRMSTVGECTRKTAEILKGQLSNADDLLFQLNDGGHFTDIAGRHELALLWLMGK